MRTCARIRVVLCDKKRPKPDQIYLGSWHILYALRRALASWIEFLSDPACVRFLHDYILCQLRFHCIQHYSRDLFRKCFVGAPGVSQLHCKRSPCRWQQQPCHPRLCRSIGPMRRKASVLVACCEVCFFRCLGLLSYMLDVSWFKKHPYLSKMSATGLRLHTC